MPQNHHLALAYLESVQGMGVVVTAMGCVQRNGLFRGIVWQVADWRKCYLFILLLTRTKSVSTTALRLRELRVGSVVNT
jgi:hypothetical protein